jgi:hypothetical protein
MVVSLSLIAVLFGCSSTESPIDGPTNIPGPAWIAQAGGVYKAEDGQTAIFAVGSYRISPNRDFMMKMARMSGRDEMARQLRITVQNMCTSYEREALDFYDEATSSSVINKEDVSRQVADEVLVGSRQISAYRDVEDGWYYVLMRCDLDNAFFNKFRESSQIAYREGFAAYTKEQKDEAMKKLDEFIEQAQQKTYPLFKAE